MCQEQGKDGDGRQMAGRNGRHRDKSEQRYEIRVGGHLGETTRTAFPGLRARARDGDTVLSGLLADQAALYGILFQLEALGLELKEVRRVP
jgi:hypothetical protein